MVPFTEVPFCRAPVFEPQPYIYIYIDMYTCIPLVRFINPDIVPRTALTNGISLRLICRAFDWA